ncbi:MAG: hypothetical protein Q6K70_11940, partial [Thermostichales cyanobacterium DRC_bins_46]
LFFGCRPAPKPETKPTLASASETQIVLYRNDGFRPAIVSEWIQVHYEITHKIAKILYWNTADESPVQLKILNQNYISGEISGYTGELQFPSDNSTYPFGILEGEFKLTHPDQRMQIFEYESPH